MRTISAIKNLKVAMLVVALILVVSALLAPAIFQQRKHNHDQTMTSSCANHAKQLGMLIMTFTGSGQQFPFESDARTAFAQMNDARDLHSWLSSSGAACPEAFTRDGSIGYIFVGDGLTSKNAVEQSALLFCCPADSHQGTDQHCHAGIGSGEMICLKSNDEMIDLLRREIGKAKGVVAYSTNALSRMERELEARLRRETQRRS